MLKNLVFVVKVSQDFIRHTDDEIQKNKPVLTKLFDLMSNVYIPFLNMFEAFEKENLLCTVGFVMPPVLCNLWTDQKIQDLYVEYLDKRIEFGSKELERTTDAKFKELAKATIEKYTKLKSDFTEKYNQNLVTAYKDYVVKGYVELLATSGTDLFIPHYSELKEIITAQIESGLHSYKQFFGEIPDGFWLPELGYAPGVEKLIKAYGYTYTILDSRSLLLAEEIPSKGIFYPVRTNNSLVLFASDVKTHSEIYGEEGIVTSAFYRNENKDVGYELDIAKLNPILDEGDVRVATGYKYWNKNYNDETKSVYDVQTAEKQAETDAEYFLQLKADKLSKVEALMSDSDFTYSLQVLDAYEMSQNWNEGIFWIEKVIRNAKKFELNVTTCNKMIENQYNLEKVVPYYSSQAGDGYGENLLSSKNCWMMRYIHKMSERMIDLADRFPTDTGLKNRLLNLGAKELMIGQSLSLAKMIDEDDNPDFAEERFKECVVAFTAIFDSLGSNTVSTEWLTNLEAKDSIFPWMNYRIFSKKM